MELTCLCQILLFRCRLFPALFHVTDRSFFGFGSHQTHRGAAMLGHVRGTVWFLSIIMVYAHKGLNVGSGGNSWSELEQSDSRMLLLVQCCHSLCCHTFMTPLALHEQPAGFWPQDLLSSPPLWPGFPSTRCKNCNQEMLLTVCLTWTDTSSYIALIY